MFNESLKLIMSNENVLRSFWFPKGYYRTTAAGLDANTVKREIDDCPCSVNPESRYQQEVEDILSAANSDYVKPRTKYVKSWANMPDGFLQIVNDALKDIYAGKRGMVFSREQAIKVCSFLYKPKIEIEDEYYYISINHEGNCKNVFT